MVDWDGAIARRAQLQSVLALVERSGVAGAGRFAAVLRRELATLPHPRWLTVAWR